MQPLCGEIHPEDGVDPRDLFRSPTNRKVTNRKTLQLCSQVADTLNLVLSGECADDVLQSLHVVAVKPAPNASQLLVVVSPSSAGQDLDPLSVHERLARASGRLRSEVAAAIVRKRAPQLVFQYVSGE
jgi:ribosome-binding factor A